MFYYPYNADSVITDKSATQPTSGDYCVSDEDFDLDLNTVVVGEIDANKTLVQRTKRSKPMEVLATALKEIQSRVEASEAAIFGIMTGGM